jgi:hypothetical protein
MYGGDVGYYCDECWEKRATGRQRRVVIVLALGLVLLGANLAGLMAFGSASDNVDMPWPIIAVMVMVLLIVMLAAVFKRRR